MNLLVHMVLHPHGIVLTFLNWIHGRRGRVFISFLIDGFNSEWVLLKIILNTLISLKAYLIKENTFKHISSLFYVIIINMNDEIYRLVWKNIFVLTSLNSNQLFKIYLETNKVKSLNYIIILLE